MTHSHTDSLTYISHKTMFLFAGIISLKLKRFLSICESKINWKWCCPSRNTFPPIPYSLISQSVSLSPHFTFSQAKHCPIKMCCVNVCSDEKPFLWSVCRMLAWEENREEVWDQGFDMSYSGLSQSSSNHHGFSASSILPALWDNYQFVHYSALLRRDLCPGL